MTKPNFTEMNSHQLNDWYEENVGYRPQVDDPSMSDDELRGLCEDYADVAEPEEFDHQAAAWDHTRDLRKHSA